MNQLSQLKQGITVSLCVHQCILIPLCMQICLKTCENRKHLYSCTLVLVNVTLHVKSTCVAGLNI